MNLKNFILSSFAGFIVYFLLGWLFYGMIFTGLYPKIDLTWIAIGCAGFALLFGYIINQWTNITTMLSGAKAGAILGALYSFSVLAFRTAENGFCSDFFLKEMVIGIICGAITAAVIAWVRGLLSD